MAKGIKVVTPGSSMDTANPTEITADTRQPGAMKIYKRFNIFKRASSMTSTYTNGVGETVGVFDYVHNLGYPPAFQVFNVEDGGLVSLIPKLELLGGPLLHAESDATIVRVDGMSLSRPTDQMAIYIFEENLDADV